MKKTLLLILALIGLTALTQTVFAQYGLPVKPDLAPFTGIDTSSSTGTGIGGGIDATATTLNVILQIIAGGLVYLAAPIAIFMIGFYGIKIKFGQENFEASKKGLIWTVVGLLIIILAVVIIRAVITIVVSTEDPSLQKEITNVEKPQGPNGNSKPKPLP